MSARCATTRIVNGKRALLGLWCVQGIGPKTLAALEETFYSLEALLDVPIAEWANAVALRPQAKTSLAPYAKLEDIAAEAQTRLQRAEIQVAFKDDAAYPPNLATVNDAPPLLFHWGPGANGRSRRRLAMVGTRHPNQGFNQFARAFAFEVAARGAGVVSGAAEGIDQACHHGALAAHGETWAFMGSGLDELDASQRELWPHVRDGGGTYFSEFPPGRRGDKSTFPRRNRLISGASDAVLVLRAGETSGALHTARYAVEQGRVLLAMPGDPHNPSAQGCLALIRDGHARICFDVEGAAQALGLTGLRAGPLEQTVVQGKLEDFSSAAQRAFSLLTKHPQDFDALDAKWGAGSAELSSALCELELAGWVVQRPGRRYEKI
ncbi:MAG: DNA-protecting protein DprA [Myxococcaceae bacterium]|nr:DNA-protecting protein DprA [Myxococcaceae bacterium]